ncbi:Golgi-associated plant pathogenesis-related protein 1-like, partial [Limulus polyphemus]|uniref:Golgi-associated plant pathogenesis-related protein 1-like n=1 Tax=Limulus polyphemus TaxID=6850 RepID=A0ABM1SQ27_LIMPO
ISNPYLPRPPGGSSGKFPDECLQWHNYYRAKHGVPLLKLSSKLCSYAQEWANHLAKTDSFQHRSDRKYGENIYMSWSSDPTVQISGKVPVDSWYSEIKDYTFGKEPRSLSSGHFTQVVWRSSTELGVAQARSKTNKIIVVANYNPAGNMVGSFAANVPPPK